MQINLPDSIYASAPVLVVLFGFGIMYVSVEGWLFFQRRRRKRSPLTKGLLRGPGESLRKAENDISLDAMAFFFAAFLAPMLVFSIHISQSYLGGTPESRFRIILSLTLASGLSVFSATKAIKLFKKLRQYRLGLECELAVGQELNTLQAHGFHVFHDFPAEKFNIDHVLVGPTGVFAIETKGRSKPMRGQGAADARVVFDGSSLKFPTWTEKNPVEQARRQAQWLHNWLTRAVGENVDVKPTLALPGWFIEIISRPNMPIYNGLRPDKIFPNYGQRRYDEKLIQRITHQLDQRCRDVEIKSDRYIKDVNQQYWKTQT